MFGGNSQPVIIPNQIGSGSAPAAEDHVSASATSGHIPYDDVDEIPHPDSLYVNGDLIPDGSQLVAYRSELLVSRPPNQLTISFRGQVYVFDAVAPDKVFYFPPFVISGEN